jgi:hypothetical protein
MIKEREMGETKDNYEITPKEGPHWKKRPEMDVDQIWDKQMKRQRTVYPGLYKVGGDQKGTKEYSKNINTE